MRTFIAFGTVFFSILVTAGHTAVGQGPPFRTAVFEMRVIEEEGERKTEGLSKVWVNFNEQKYTTETDVTGPSGKRTKYATILGEGKAYVLNMEAKTAQEIPYSEDSGPLMDWARTPDYKRFGGIAVGLDTIAGLDTEIYEYVKFEERIQLSPDIGGEGYVEMKDWMNCRRLRPSPQFNCRSANGYGWRRGFLSRPSSIMGTERTAPR